MGDPLTQLPVNDSEPTQVENQFVDILFKEKLSTAQKILHGTRDVLLLGLLFLVISLPQLDTILHKFFPSTVDSPYMLLFIRTLLFMLVYFIVKNLYLAKLPN